MPVELSPARTVVSLLRSLSLGMETAVVFFIVSEFESVLWVWCVSDVCVSVCVCFFFLLLLPFFCHIHSPVRLSFHLSSSFVAALLYLFTSISILRCIQTINTYWEFIVHNNLATSWFTPESKAWICFFGCLYLYHSIKVCVCVSFIYVHQTVWICVFLSRFGVLICGLCLCSF